MNMVSDLRHFGLKAKNLKCFEDWQGFDSIFPINLIIGRNNAGKSALLDLVWCAVRGFENNPQFSRKGQPVSVEFSYAITQSMVELAFQDGVQIGHLGSGTRSVALRDCVGLRVVRNSTAGQSQVLQVLSQGNEVRDEIRRALVQRVENWVGYPLGKLKINRLRADRDIKSDASGVADHVGEDGNNATQLVERYINEAHHHHLVEQNLLNDLNLIIQPDWSFRRIFPKRVAGTSVTWELNLEGSDGTLVPLSHTGSGVKTLLLVLVILHLVPHAQKALDLSSFVFCFEELENNLHPAVQRRLFRYLRDKAVKERCTFFLTTHSSAVIDLFSRDDQAQILHVLNDQTKATVQPATTNLRRSKILDDLDVKASDLLQANVIVWVEGPSDRLYFNKWVELWSDGTLVEQNHYQCVWYGGSMLAGMTFEAEVPDDDLVAALKVNRHAIILMDSDSRDSTSQLKLRVQRVCEEAANNEAFAWVTSGREVENYLPVEALRLALKDDNIQPPGQYANVYDHLSRSADKVDMARLVTPHITKNMLASLFDLKQQLDEVCRLIRKWNSMPT